MFWLLVYRPEEFGPIAPNLIYHGIPALTYLADILLNRLSYATHPKNALANMALSVGYAVVNCTYIMAGGKSEKGEEYLYKALQWETNPLMAVVYSAGRTLAFGAVNQIFRLIKKIYHCCFASVVSRDDSSSQQPLLDDRETTPAQSSQSSLWSRFQTLFHYLKPSTLSSNVPTSHCYSQPDI